MIHMERTSNRPYQLVVVESPSKCSTISKILQEYVDEHDLDFDYHVVSSAGHVRNLPRSGSGTVAGIDTQQDYKPTYAIIPGKEGVVKNLHALAKDATQVVLATDEDREGEAVAWHLTQLMPKNVPHIRVTFTEITPKAIRDAIENARPSLDMDLVEAQETRRILDRLAGYTLSPILWKKIAPGLSAGRVQSVGMALIVQRERERLLFRPAQYWNVKATIDDRVEANLMKVNGMPLATGTDFDDQGQLKSSKTKLHLAEHDAYNLLAAMSGGEVATQLQKPNISSWTVSSITSKKRSINPPMPFITSTLQQEANNRLGMSASQTMSCAQSLYEGGYISYMRTDSTQLSDDAHYAIEQTISSVYGPDLRAPPRKQKAKKSKNAQEAHEAIRPAIQANGGFHLDASKIEGVNEASRQLYTLIVARTLASRMKVQVINSTTVDVEGVSPDGTTTLTFRATGSVVVKPGFTLAFGDTKSTIENILPPYQEGQEIAVSGLSPIRHDTSPPPRYTEASFVKELEEFGVGRPSTYANTIKILRERAYVGTPVRASDSGNRSRRGKIVSGSAISAQRAAGGEDFTGSGRGPLVPSLSAFVVCSLLEKHCATYVDPGFTATMEERLDMIARGEEGAERVKYLDEFYAGEDGLAAKIKQMDENVKGDEARRVSLPGLLCHEEGGENDDGIALLVGPWGPYIQQVTHNRNGTETVTKAPLPPGMALDVTTINSERLAALLSSREKDGVLLGAHPDDGRDIRLKVGRYGAYLQWGENGADSTTTHSLPKHIASLRKLNNKMDDTTSGGDGVSLSNMIDLTLEEAVGYVSLPRTVCTFRDLPIIASIGPYGPYLKYNNSFVSLKQSDGEVITIDADTAERVVTEGIIDKPHKLARGVIAELGEMNGGMVKVKDGRFGIYLNWKRVNTKLPNKYKDNPSEISLEEAWELIEAKDGAATGKKSSRKQSRGEKKKKRGEESAEDGVMNRNIPDPPKRPKTAYLLFCSDKRQEVMANYPMKKPPLGEVSKELARLWAETNDDASARQKYVDQAAIEKANYQAKVREWKDECERVLGESKKGTSSNNKRVNKETKPKRPMSAYLCFCAEKRAEVSESGMSLGDVSKKLAELWAKAKNTDEHKRFEEMAAAYKLRYEQELMANRNGVATVGEAGVVVMPNSNGSTIKSAKTQKATKSRKTQKATKSAKTQKATKEKKPRARSAYMIFCSENRKTILDDNGNKLPLGETTKRLAKLWNEVDDEIKKEFETKAEVEKQAISAGSIH